jgi:ubiquinone/menaquinone biosynthesis C-methylase UbiE
MDNQSVASWEGIADEWAPFADNNDFRVSFLLPETIKLLGDVKGKRILDLGCGEGGYSRVLAQQGADVTAVDGSSRMIAIAEDRARGDGLSITHLVRELASLEGIEDGSFEVVVAAMSLMQSETDYPKAIEEIRRVLALGGKLLMSIAHPCFTSQGCGWETSDEGGSEHYVVLNYYDKQPWEQFMSAAHFENKVIFNHMPLQDFMAPLLATGFRLTLFSEPIPGRRAIHESYRLSKLSRVPLFLFMQWVREP